MTVSAVLEAFMTVSAVLEGTLSFLLLLILQNTVPRGNHDGFGGFGGCGGFGRDSWTGYPP